MVSVTVTVAAGAVFSVTGNVPVPLASGESCGSTARGSELEKCTIPAYAATTVFEASKADTVMLKDVPMTWGVVLVTEKCVATGGGGAADPPQPAMSHNPQIESRTDS